MLALTLIQPMGWAIVANTIPAQLRKNVENRSRDVPHALRGEPTIVAVHSGSKWDDAYASTILRITGRAPPRYARSSVIGVMCLTGRRFTTNSPSSSLWWSGPYGYEIYDAHQIETPVPCAGALGFWTLGANELHALSKQLPAPWWKRSTGRSR